MRYQGGKSRIAKDICKIINEYSTKYFNEIETNNSHTHTLVSLFCGSCAIENELTNHFDNVICNDIHEYLIAMFKALQNGYSFPDEISYELWDYTRKHKDEDKALTGYIGFGSSFGGRFFQGYARTSERDKEIGKKRNYALETKNSLMKHIDEIKKIKFVCDDYKNVSIPDNAIVYCDPPYNNTTAYRYQEKFDIDIFWNYIRDLSQNHLVFVSEQNSPDDFVSIWEKPITTQICRNSDKYFTSTEHLFIYNKYSYLIKN